MKIIVTGQIARYPLGGVTWDWLNYILGFRKLGHEVHYFEDGPKWLYNPMKHSVMISDYNVTYLKKVMGEFGFDSQWTYLSRGGSIESSKIYGNKNIQEIFQSADIIFNIAGSTNMQLLTKEFPMKNGVKKVFIDGDPMINQMKILNDGSDNIVTNSHDLFFTYAENIGKKDCKIPRIKDVKWMTTRFPVHLPSWSAQSKNKTDTFTTISNWQSYKGYTFNGQKYSGSKSTEFLKFFDIPKITGQKMEIALAADTEKKENIVHGKKLKNMTWLRNKNNLEKMEKAGWKITDPLKISKDWNSYKKYIEGSYGEWSVAKNAYVKAHTGWFSCRSACYLASGKPVILEDTQFSKFIRTGKGLFSFKNKNEALHAINEIHKNYEYHCAEARNIAEKYFDSDKVLRDMLKKCKIKNKK